MLEFLAGQLDYVYFFYGLGYIMLAAVAFALRHIERQKLTWGWFGAFGILRGLEEWLELIAATSDSWFFSAIRSWMAILACLCLLEFSRASIQAIKGTNSSRWILLPFILVAGIFAIFNVANLEIPSRHTLGFIAGITSAYAIYLAARRYSNAARQWLLSCSIILVIFAILAGFSVPQQPFYPKAADSFNTIQLLGFPIQYLRGLLALWVAVSLWMYFHTLCRTTKHGKRRSQIAIWTTAAVLFVLVLGWIFTNYIGNWAIAETKEEMLHQLQMLAAAINSDSLLNISRNPNAPDNKRLKHQLSDISKTSNKISCLQLICKNKEQKCYVSTCYSFIENLQNNKSADVENYRRKIDELLNSGKPFVAEFGSSSKCPHISVFVPLRIAGRTVPIAALRADICKFQLTKDIARYRLFGIITVLLLCVSTIIYFLILQKKEEYTSQIIESERKYRSLVEGSPNWVALFDSETRCIATNRTCFDVMGWSESDVIGKPLLKLWPKSARKVISAALEKVLNGSRASYEAESSGPKGKFAIWHAVLNPIIGDDGEVESFVAIFTEITKRKQAEEALRESEEKYKNLIETTDIGYVILNKDGIVIDANNEYTRLTGHKDTEEIIGHSILEWTAEYDRDFNNNGIEKLLKERLIKDVEVDYVWKDGTVVPVEINASLVLMKDGLKIIGLCRDISDRKKAEAALRESEEKYRVLAENSSDAIWLLDKNLNITYVNSAVKDFGYEPDELIGVNAKDILTAESYDLCIKQLEHIINTKSIEEQDRIASQPLEIHLLNKDRTIAACEMKASLLRDEKGHLKGIICITRDISERKRIEHALQENSRFLQNIFDAIQDGICVLDPELNIVHANAAMQKWFEHSMPLVGNKCYKAYHGSQTQCENCPTIRALNSGKLEIEILPIARENERVGWVEVFAFPLLDKDGKVQLVIESVRDVTERKERESDLLVLTSAMNAASDQIMVTDSSGTIQFVNAAFERETGYSAAEVVGKKPAFLKSGYQEEEFYSHLWNTIKNGHTWHGEVTNRRKDGSTFVEDMTITPVKNDDGQIEHFIAIKRNITEKKLYEEQLDHMAHHDPLTGLPNRLLFSDRLTQRLAQARRNNGALAVMFLDLDKFKAINDTLGHNVGDLLLKTVAERLTLSLREVDTIARMGGDEFTVIVSDIKTADDAVVVAKKILDAMQKPYMLDGHELYVSTSIGISLYPDDGLDAEELVKNADEAMYKAKESGRNNYHLYSESITSTAMDRMKLEKGLRKALEREEFVLYYQPRVDMRTGRTLGTEALVRWQHPEIGLVPPNQFIPLAEETGIIVPITQWVLHTACKQNKEWIDDGLPPMEVAVNISARLFQHGDLVETVRNALTKTGLPAKYLDLEITEGVLMSNDKQTAEILRELKSMGVRITIDDFGTGYSSLSGLNSLPIDAVKIDRSFVRDINTNSDNAAIAEAIIVLSHSLKLSVIAEGVETLEQLEFLKKLGCDEMQGYFVSRPVSSQELTQLLKEVWLAEGGISPAA